jgi:hypothetical protein
VELVNCAAIQASASERQIHRQVTRSARPPLERIAKSLTRRGAGNDPRPITAIELQAFAAAGDLRRDLW